MRVAGKGAAAVPLALAVPALLVVCYLAGCGQRGPLTLPVRESEPRAVPAGQPAATENEQEPAENETDEQR